MDGEFNIEQVITFIINFLSASFFSTNLSKNFIWNLFCFIIAYAYRVVIISISDPAYFIYFSLRNI